MNKKIIYGWKEETMDFKIREMLSLSLAQRHKVGFARGILARWLERNQERLYGRGLFKTVQVLKQK